MKRLAESRIKVEVYPAIGCTLSVSRGVRDKIRGADLLPEHRPETRSQVLPRKSEELRLNPTFLIGGSDEESRWLNDNDRLLRGV